VFTIPSVPTPLTLNTTSGFSSPSPLPTNNLPHA
jgi:hypothetical protein